MRPAYRSGGIPAAVAMRLLREALYGKGAEFRVLVADLPCVLELIRIAPHLHCVEAVELVGEGPSSTTIFWPAARRWRPDPFIEEGEDTLSGRRPNR